MLALGALLVLPYLVIGPGNAPSGFELLAMVGAVLLFVGLVCYVISGRD